MKSTPSHSGDLLYPLIGILAFSAAPHLIHLPFWVIFCTVSAWGWRILTHTGHLPSPPPWLFKLFAGLGFLIILVTSNGMFAQTGGTRLLVLMAGLKPFETHTRRDRILLVFLADFLVIASLFVSDGLPMTLYMGIALIGNQAVLAKIADPDLALKTVVGFSAKLFVLSLPLAALLFFLFPRLSGQLWGIRQKVSAATGFSETLRMGDVAGLVQNRSIAFRVQFDDAIPPVHDRYFRGIVFRHIKNGTWQPDKTPKPLPSFPAKDPLPETGYTLTAEPHHSRWLFALDWPDKAAKGTRLHQGGIFRSPHPVRTRIRYRATAVASPRHLLPPEKADTGLPPDQSPKARTLAAQIRQKAKTDTEVVLATLAWFRNQPFRYTLFPPPLSGDPVDGFLFGTRAGYCEHYATAFATLMRAAKIPARIIGGYLGGEVNPLGSYLIIRQSDAHAWVEVFTKENGWTRIDPTATVAPERVEMGMAQALSSRDAARMPALSGTGRFSSFLRPVRLVWDGANHFWNRQILGYSRKKQTDLLQRMGLAPDRPGGLFRTVGLAALVIAVMIGLLYLFTGRSKGQRDPVLALWERFTRKLSAAGHPKPAHEGPFAYTRRVAALRCDIADQVTEIGDLYIRIRYGNTPEKEDIHKFRRAVRSFRPARNRS